jgi:hypothetical protein
MKLVDDWKHQIWRHALIALFWTGIGGLLMVWPALIGTLSLRAYVLGGVVISIAYGIAKVLHRPGTD